MGWSNAVLTVSAPVQARVAFQTFALPNGLRVMLAENHAAPTYSICVAYNVGSRDESPGRTGWAHLFEHMMFQGSANVGKREHSVLVVNQGGSANGTTNADRTNYFETLPANQLELGIFLEADRMRSLQVTQANFDNQRQVVQEERRQNYSNSRYSLCNVRLHLTRAIFEGVTSLERSNAVQILPKPSLIGCQVATSFLI